MVTTADVRHQAMRSWLPPPQKGLADWIEQNLRLYRPASAPYPAPCASMATSAALRTRYRIRWSKRSHW